LVNLFEKQKYPHIIPLLGKKPRERLMKACMYLDIDAQQSAAAEFNSILESETISPLFRARIQEEDLYQKLFEDSLKGEFNDPL